MEISLKSLLAHKEVVSMEAQTTAVGCDCNNDEVLLERIRKVCGQQRGKEGNLIQVLHTVQAVYGYLPQHVQEIVSIELGIPLAEVSGVASFYSFFSTEPRGKHTIRICLGTACYVRGGVTIVDTLEKALGVTLLRPPLTAERLSRAAGDPA